MQQGARYQFKHVKMGGNFSENDATLAVETATGWEVVAMGIDRRLGTTMLDRERVEFVYLLRRPA